MASQLGSDNKKTMSKHRIYTEVDFSDLNEQQGQFILRQLERRKLELSHNDETNQSLLLSLNEAYKPIQGQKDADSYYPDAIARVEQRMQVHRFEKAQIEAVLNVIKKQND